MRDRTPSLSSGFRTLFLQKSIDRRDATSSSRRFRWNRCRRRWHGETRDDTSRLAYRLRVSRRPSPERPLLLPHEPLRLRNRTAGWHDGRSHHPNKWCGFALFLVAVRQSWLHWRDPRSGIEFRSRSRKSRRANLPRSLAAPSWRAGDKGTRKLLRSFLPPGRMRYRDRLRGVLLFRATLPAREIAASFDWC